MYEACSTGGDTVRLNKTKSVTGVRELVHYGAKTSAVKLTDGLVQIVSDLGSGSAYSLSTKVINGHKCFKLECGISVQNHYWLYLMGSD